MNTIPISGLDLNKKIREINENGDWIEVVAPKWLYESLCAEDEDEDVALACPYLIWEFEKWLMDKRGISEKALTIIYVLMNLPMNPCMRQ